MIKLSPFTISVLKNFKTINANLVVAPGNVLSTIDEANTIQATAEVPEQFDTEFGIYDLNEFYSVYDDLFDDPELEISSDSATITDNNLGLKATYRFADKSILTYPKKDIKMPTADVTVDISENDLSRIRSAANVLGHKTVSIVGKDGVISAQVVDPKNPTANTFTLVLDENNDCKDEFEMQILIANLKVLPGPYQVEICYNRLSKWTHATECISYFIALEKTSPGKIN